MEINITSQTLFDFTRYKIKVKRGHFWSLFSFLFIFNVKWNEKWFKVSTFIIAKVIICLANYTLNHFSHKSIKVPASDNTKIQLIGKWLLRLSFTMTLLVLSFRKMVPQFWSKIFTHFLMPVFLAFKILFPNEQRITSSLGDSFFIF